MKTKALISFAVTAMLICVFVFAYAEHWFSHDAALLLVNCHCLANLSIFPEILSHNVTEIDNIGTTSGRSLPIDSKGSVFHLLVSGWPLNLSQYLDLLVV